MKLDDFKKNIAASQSLSKLYASVEVCVTQHCNCKCDYCFESKSQCQSNQHLDERLVVEKIEDACNNIDFSKFAGLQIVFWGGEPTLSMHFVEEIVAHTQQFGFVSYLMYTNGMDNDAFLHMFSSSLFNSVKERFSIQFSFDGEPHHFAKRHANSSIMMQNAELMQRAGFKISFKATLSFDLIHLLPDCWRSYESLYSRFGDCVQYAPTLDMTCVDPDAAQLAQWEKTLVEVARLEIGFCKQHDRPLMAWFNGCQKKSCNANCQVYIHNDGTMHVCHGMPYAGHKATFGVFDENVDLYSIASQNDSVDAINTNAECRQCDAVYCAVCHAMQVDINNLHDDWCKCMPRNAARCQFFRKFGEVYRAFRISLLKSLQA